MFNIHWAGWRARLGIIPRGRSPRIVGLGIVPRVGSSPRVGIVGLRVIP